MLHDYRCEILENKACGPACGSSLWVMRLKSLDKPFQCEPGQFVMFDLPQPGFYFRRPFSLLDKHADGSFDLLYKVVGFGTDLMAKMQPGDTTKVLSPLGKAFTVNPNQPPALLIGGGIGIAPLYYLAKQHQKQFKTQPFTCLYGVRGQADLGIEAEIKSVFPANQLHIATDLGDTGFHGNVCQLLENQPALITETKEAYICGPNRMMSASVKLLKKLNPTMTVYVSLETPMPCGTGACMGCVISRSEDRPPVRTCVEGPVFNAADLLWGDAGPIAPGGEKQAWEAASACHC